QRSVAILSDCLRHFSAGGYVSSRGRRVARIGGAIAGGFSAHLVESWASRRESDVRGLVRAGGWTRIRAVVWILVHRFFGGAARAGGQDMNAAQRTPLIAALPKMFIPFL